MVGSVATNDPPHIPMPPGASFQRRRQPRDGQQRLQHGHDQREGRRARSGDPVRTCNDPTDARHSAITAGAATVTIG